MCICTLHTGANPLLTNGLGHTAQAYAKEGDVKTILQEWESKVSLKFTWMLISICCVVFQYKL